MNGDLLLISGRVITMDPAQPLADAVAVRGGRIVASGSEAECRAAAPAGAAVLRCAGRTIVPGFVDAHIHLAAYAAALRSVDCSPARAHSIEDIVRLIQERAVSLPPGAWVRAAGYDETALAEGRHPTRWDLDRAAPAHPVRLLHRSGHGVVLNSRALALAGITIATEEPPGAFIDRRPEDGEPTGLLLEMNDLVGRVVPPLPRDELVAGMRAAGARLLAAGVTAVQDMTHTNDREAAAFLAELAAESGFVPRLLSPAEGWTREDAPSASGTGRPVKVMVREIGARPVPDEETIADIIAACAAHGRQAAIHAVERWTVEAVVRAFEQAGAGARTVELRHRIEHAGVCPPDLAERIAAAGLIVVSNPGFLWYGGDRYLHQVPAADLPDLYAVGSLHAAGVRLAAGSDAPVVPPDPLHAMTAAVLRQTISGAALPGRLLPPLDALALHTTGAAFAARAEGEIGNIRPGMRADLVVLSGEPGQAGTWVEMTIAGGEVRWVRDGTARPAAC